MRTGNKPHRYLKVWHTSVVPVELVEIRTERPSAPKVKCIQFEKSKDAQ